MSYDNGGYRGNRERRGNDSYGNRDNYGSRPREGRRENDGERERDEVYSKRVPAGKRTYFFDVKTTRSGEDYFLTITESKRSPDGRYEKHKIFLYKEDFGKFVEGLMEAIDHVRDERLTDYDFSDVPRVVR